MESKPSGTKIKLNALKREAFWRLSKVRSGYHIAEFPKSGGTWLGQLLSEVSGCSFQRNNSSPAFNNVILHGHKLYSDMYSNVCVMHRDGRDIMISAYYHFLYENEWNHAPYVKRVREELGFKNVDDVKENLPDFIEWMNFGYSRGRFRFTWPEFVFSWADKDVPAIKYEELLSLEASALFTLANEIGIKVDREGCEKAFEKYRAKRKGSSTGGGSFLRKAIVGDWKNYFDRESSRVFNKYNGEALVKLGYEEDLSWPDKYM